MRAVSQEIVDQLIEEVKRSFAAGEYAQARRMLKRFMRRKTAKETRTQIQILLGKSYIDEGKWKKALEILNRGITAALRNKNFKAASSILNYVGDCHVLRGDMKTANRHFNRSLRLCKEKGISGDILARNISDLAQTAELQGEYRKSLPRWEEAVSIYRTLSASREHAYALLNTAMLKSRLGKVDEGIVDAKEALDTLSGLARKAALSDCLWLLGSLHAQKGEYTDGLNYMEKAVQESGGAGGLELVRAYIAYTGTLIEIGAFTQARQYGEEALAISRSLKWNRGAAICQVHLARVRVAEEDYVAALHYVREAERIFSAAGFPVGKARALMCEVETLTRLLSLERAGKVLDKALSISKKTDDIPLKNDCIIARAMMLIVRQKADDATATELQQLCEQLKKVWCYQYLRAKYHLAALLMADEKLEEASGILKELLEKTGLVISSLPDKYRDAYRNSPLAKGITRLVLELQMEKALKHASIDTAATALVGLRVQAEVKPAALAEAPSVPAAPQEFVFESSSMGEVVSNAKRVARTGMPILITGETGVGKELLARHIHHLSGRKGRFVPVNCAAVPSSLMESELFGYVKGAFTGAARDRDGLFLAADGGSLFLDEISSMPLPMQAKMLRVLEEGSVRPLGATEHVTADVRLLCATNSDLKEEVARGRFREDLFYRMNVVTLNIPPLCHRPEDIPILLQRFLKNAGREVTVEGAALDALVRYRWPGNVRELRNEVARLLVEAGATIERSMLKDEIIQPTTQAPTGGLQEMEHRIIRDVLRRTGNNKQKAAKILGISRSTLYQKMKRYRIEYTES